MLAGAETADVDVNHNNMEISQSMHYTDETGQQELSKKHVSNTPQLVLKKSRVSKPLQANSKQGPELNSKDTSSSSLEGEKIERIKIQSLRITEREVNRVN